MAPRDFNSLIYHFWVQFVSNFHFGDFWAYFGQETKLALKFNFTKENMCPLAFLAKLTVGQCSL